MSPANAPRPRHVSPAAAPSTNQSRAQAGTGPHSVPSGGLDLARRLRVAAMSDAAAGTPGAPAQPPRSAAPKQRAEAAGQQGHSGVSPPVSAPDGKALLKMMQANATTASAAARPGKVAPSRTKFTGKSASPAVPGPQLEATARLLPHSDLKRAVVDALLPGPPPALVAVGFVTASGDSNFTLSSTTAALGDHPHSSDAAISLLVAAFNGAVYTFGKGRDACEKLVGLLVDVQFTAKADIVTFGAPSLLAALAATATSLGQLDAVEPRRVSDVRLMGWLLRPDQRAEGFDDFLSLHAEVAPGLPQTSLPPGTPDGVIARLHMLPHVHRPLHRALARRGTIAAYMSVERPLMFTLACMKSHGFRVDLDVVEAASTDAARAMDTAREEAQRLLPAGISFGGSTGAAGFNIQSPDHCRKVLYDSLRLQQHLDGDDGHTTGTGKVSTSEETLKLLCRFHPLPGVILSYRKVAKLRQTYFEGLFSRAIEAPGVHEARVHATFLQDGTDTGRLSCADPNLQNLPRCASEMLGAVRGAFIPDAADHVLLAIDYEQIELRVLAHMSGDESLRAALTSGDEAQRDIHRRIAARIFHKDFAAVSGTERTAAKRVVFGVIYGMGPKALAAQLEMPVDEARGIMNDFKRGFPAIERYISAVHATCRDTAEVRTILNRCRPLPDIRDSNPQRRAAAERQAFNAVIQGSAADIVKKAMVDVASLIRTEPAEFAGVKMLSQIHDELVFTCPRATYVSVARRLKAAMEGCMALAVPLVVKPQAGPNLADLEDVG